MTTDQRALEVAIIGGGITGVTLALGLLCRNVKFTIYERADEFREIGAGIGFTPNAERAMKKLDPRIHQCFRNVAVRNKDDWFRYVDGFNHNRDDPADTIEELVCQMYLGERGFEGCLRSDFLLEISNLLPLGYIQFGKSLKTVEDDPDEGKDQVSMVFDDGSTAQADVVIGCDGINSTMRTLMFSTTFPACKPAYTHKFAFRGLVSADKARTFLGHEKTTARHLHMGADAHALTFPVAEGNLINIVAFVTDSKPWAGSDGRFVMPASKSEAVDAFANFGPAAVFDMYDDPLPTFVSKRLCVAGDAAHASSPHHGAGAGCGIEDSLALAELLATAQGKISLMSWKTMIPEALAVYNEMRYERAQWLVESSRIVGEMYEWQHQQTKEDVEKWRHEFEIRCHKIWDFDINEMVQQGLRAFDENFGRKLSIQLVDSLEAKNQRF